MRQPGPAPLKRFESVVGTGRKLDFTLEPGLTLNEAVAGPLSKAGMKAASLVLEGGSFLPFQYLMPALSTDGHHAAWYSEPRAPSGETRLENGNVTFGERDGAPFVHCHATFIERDGKRHAGHVLPLQTTVGRPIRASAWCTKDVRMVAVPDAETGFTLFRPIASELNGNMDGPRVVIARVRPNTDIIETLEAILMTHGLAEARLRGGIGSLIGARYVDGSSVGDAATEVFVTNGFVSTRSNSTSLEIVMVDTKGAITRGQLLRGENPVCITFELFLEEA